MENSFCLIKNKNRLWTLFKTCFLISACTFGGGMVIISLLQKKFVEELGWIDQNEVMDLTAIAQSCPGVMSVNTSIMIGYRICGPLGAVITALGTVMPPMIILSLISLFYTQFRSNPAVSVILKGMQAGVAAVMMNVSITMTSGVITGASILTWIMLIGAAAAVLILDADIISIAKMTPGPLGINIASFVGTRTAGVAGTLIATLSYILPALVIVLILSWFYDRYRSLEGVQGVLSGLRPAVVAMIIAAAVQLVGTAWWDGLSHLALENTNWTAVVLSLVLLILLQKKKLGPIQAILASGAVGGAVYWFLPQLLP